MEERYIADAEAAGVDVTSSFPGREGTSTDAFHFRHLQLAVEAQTSMLERGHNSLFKAPDTSQKPSKERHLKKFQHPHGSGEAWR